MFGRKLDVGIDNQFIKNVGNDMKPGDSALFLLTENITVDKVADALREYGGTLYHTSFSKEAEEQLAKALERGSLGGSTSGKFTGQPASRRLWTPSPMPIGLCLSTF